MPLLEMRKISKRFPGVRALEDVSLTLETGEVHSIVGENGAGKSTLIKVLSGVYPSGTFRGEISIDGRLRYFRNVADAEAAGIAVIYQEFSLVRGLTVAANIFLGQEPATFGVIKAHELRSRALELLTRLQLDISPDVEVENLGVGQQQLVEIAKALSRNARILVLDEPTAALTEAESRKLFSIIADLRSRGVGVVYISHKIDEVLSISDRITVLRDGCVSARYAAGEAIKGGLIRAMVGREVDHVYPHTTHAPGEVVLNVHRLTVFSSNRRVVDDVSFSVRRGEVLGIAGLMGSHRTELLTALFGAWLGQVTGTVEIAGRRVYVASPADAIRNGIALVTEDRQRYGLISTLSVTSNITLPALRSITGRLFTDRRRETAATVAASENLHLRSASPNTIVGTLSGGNQQKVVLGKWLLTTPRILLLDEPTRGIDVGAKQEIYAEVAKLAAEGMAIVLVSSELPEVLGLSDRIIVLRKGRLTGEFTRAEATPEKIMAAATAN